MSDSDNESFNHDYVTEKSYILKRRNGQYHFKMFQKEYNFKILNDIQKKSYQTILIDSDQKQYLAQFYYLQKKIRNETEFMEKFKLHQLFQSQILLSSLVLEILDYGYLIFTNATETYHFMVTIHPYHQIIHLNDLVYQTSHQRLTLNQRINQYQDLLLNLLQELISLDRQGLIRIQISPDKLYYDLDLKCFWVLDLTSSIYFDDYSKEIIQLEPESEDYNYRYLVPEELIYTDSQYNPLFKIDCNLLNLQSYLVLVNLIIFRKTLFSYYFNREEPLPYLEYCINIWQISHQYIQNKIDLDFKRRWSQIYSDFRNSQIPLVNCLVDFLNNIWNLEKISLRTLQKKLKKIFKKENF